MTYDEFERRLLKIVFEEQKESLTPSFLAYKLQIPHTEVKQHLDQSLENGIVELHVDSDGKVNYVVPGFEPNSAIVEQKARHKPQQLFEKATKYSRNTSPDDTYTPHREESIDEAARREVDEIAPHSPISSKNLPAIVDDASDLDTVAPRYSIYIRKIRVYGDYSDVELSERISSLIQEFGYVPANDPECLIEPGNDLYKRGSFFFILLLIPFFILVVPLIAYAIMHSLGHSTLRSEPVFLEIGKKRLNTIEPIWEITLTFRGLHGIVFGRPDRALIDKEVEMLAAELQQR